MSAAMRLPDYLDHMVDAVLSAAQYVSGMDKAAFFADRRTQQAVLMNIVILGEASAKVLAEHALFAEQQPGIPWRAIRAMRNRVAHGYFEINLDLVWETVTVALPDLAVRLPAVRDAAKAA